MRGTLVAVAVLVCACGQGEFEAGDTDALGLGDGSSTAGPSTVPSTATSTTGTATSAEPEPMETHSTQTAGTSTSADPCTPITVYVDADGDGFGLDGSGEDACDVVDGYVLEPGDCDDDNPDAFPGATEACGGDDDLDCDGNEPPLCASCIDLVTGGNGASDGLYTLDLDGTEGPEPPVQVYCDQTTSGGGWILMQRTVWDPALTDALQTTYVQWRSLTIGDAASGAYRLRGELWDDAQGLFDHMLRVDLRIAADGTSCEPLFYFGSGGVLDVAESGTTMTGMVSPVAIVNSTEFSATDAGPSTSCINSSGAVPWFYGSCCSTCPRFHGSYWNEPHPMVSYVNSVDDGFGRREPDVCPTPAAAAINGSSFRGANAMEYYVR